MHYYRKGKTLWTHLLPGQNGEEGSPRVSVAGVPVAVAKAPPREVALVGAVLTMDHTKNNAQHVGEIEIEPDLYSEVSCEYIFPMAQSSLSIFRR